MKKIFRSLLLTAITATAFSAANAQFTTGNVVVLQVGDGTAALGATGTAIILKEYTPNTLLQLTPVTTVSIPTTGTARLVSSGTATSEGQMTLSQDSTKLLLSGYDTTTSVLAVASSTSANIARAVDTVGNAGIAGKADTTKTAFSGGSIRSAARNSGENYWAVGANSGIYYLGNNTTPAAIYNITTNLRVINAANGKLYFSTASGLSRIGRINSQATSGNAVADTMITLGSGTTPSPYGFAVNPAETIVYVADDRTGTGGGIQKWTGSGTTWTLAYTFSTGLASGARGITVDWSGTYPVIYAITNTTSSSGGNLIKITDSNSTAPFLILATAGVNTAFRSVAFAPKIACTTPVLAAAITNRTCAANGAITLSLTSGSTPTSYLWTGPNGFTSSTQNITNLQAGIYMVTATAPGGCIGTLTSVVANNATLTATATPGGPTTFCAGGNVVLSANTGTGYTYQWNNTSGAIPGATSSTYTATTANTYTVTITSGVNCTATSAPVTVVVNALPSTTVTASGPTTFCAGDSVIFTAAAGNTYQWKNNGASISGATNNTYKATTSGSYTVTVTNLNGCSATSTAIAVTVNPIPTVVIVAGGSTTFCTGGSVQLCAQPSTSTTNFPAGTAIQWFLNGAALAGATTACITANTSGSYCVHVINSQGCVSPLVCQTVTAGPPPSATVTPAGPLSICAGSSVVLHTNSTPGLSYQWYNGSTAITSNGNDSVYTVTGAGTYHVTVSSGTGCTSTSTNVIVSVNALPAATLAPAAAQSVCVGQSVALNANTGTGYTYQYFNGASQISGATAAAYTFTGTAPGVNIITVKVTDANSCSAISGGDTITVNAKPVAMLSASADTVCQKSFVTLVASYTGVPAATIQFFKSGAGAVPSGNLAFIAVTDTLSGSQTGNKVDSFRVVITSAAGCADTTAWKQIVFSPLPKPVIIYTPGVLTTQIPYASYQWYFNGLPVSGATAQVFNITSNGSYNVMVTDSRGCRDSASASKIVTGLAVHNIGGMGGIKVYPNPATTILSIEAPFVVNVVMRDMQGRVVLQADNAQKINIANLADGVYQLAATDATGRSLGAMRVVKLAN